MVLLGSCSVDKAPVVCIRKGSLTSGSTSGSILVGASIVYGMLFEAFTMRVQDLCRWSVTQAIEQDNGDD